MSSQETKSVVSHDMLRPRKTTAQVLEAQAAELDLSRAAKPMRYSVLAQSSSDLRDQSNSPSISMWPYLLTTAQTQRLNEISVYTQAGTTAEAVRLLYLNDVALSIWADMKKDTTVIGRLHRPPRAAVLAFGMPFSE